MDLAGVLQERLVARWTSLSSIEEMVREVASRLADSDMEIDRLSLATLPVYSAHDGVQHVWQRAMPDEIRMIVRPAGFLDDPEHLSSPLHQVLTTGMRLRERLCVGEGVGRFAFLASLSQAGCTDYLAVPLPTRRATVHVLSIATRRPGGWDEGDLLAFESLLPMFGMLVEVWECERLLEAVATDALTKIGNRRAFEASLRNAWSTCARAQTPISLVCFDIDHFKSFNDTYGHVAGDRCLARIASAAGACAQRTSDTLARLGGEEFALLLPASPSSGARIVGERVRAAVAALAIPHASSAAAPHVTVSVGTATLAPGIGSERTQLLELADMALYRAKEQGRNRVESA
ncbi:MAG: diguanylate cyclase domain-containing protein [Alphaproteobacteria bacterium]